MKEFCIHFSPNLGKKFLIATNSVSFQGQLKDINTHIDKVREHNFQFNIFLIRPVTLNGIQHDVAEKMALGIDDPFEAEIKDVLLSEMTIEVAKYKHQKLSAQNFIRTRFLEIQAQLPRCTDNFHEFIVSDSVVKINEKISEEADDCAKTIEGIISVLQDGHPNEHLCLISAI